jgi:hypothetical protein
LKSFSKHFQFLNLFSNWFQYSNRLSICFQIKFGNRFLKFFFRKSVGFAPLWSCNLFLCRVILGLRSRETSAAAVMEAAVASTARQGLTVSLTA